ncbi:MAG: glycerol kinase [Eubacteriales bacterium]
MKYILAVDQSTQGTKGLLFDGEGRLAARADRPHRQIVNEKGWVSHDPMEILRNTLGVCRDVLEKAGVNAGDVEAFGISNQRETSLMWDRETGRPVCDAIVWQCARAAEIAELHEKAGEAEKIWKKTGLRLSPYFPAAKLQWIMEHVPEARALASRGKLAAGTIDTWLVWNLTEGHKFRTDYSNAARTQLFNSFGLAWDKDLLRMFGIPESAMPEVSMSDSVFGMTDLGGLLPKKVPVCGVLGDSNGALFGQNCRRPGGIKATYGTGSSVMMNIGEKPVLSESGLVTSIAWGIGGKVSYVLEGNLNYTGAVITWLKDEMHLISSAGETEELAEHANPKDRSYFIPAFTGLGAPYWDSEATGLFTGITRTTGRCEMVRACLDSIAYQITDLVKIMRKESGQAVRRLHVDGGPTANRYLMQFQASMAETDVIVPDLQELSGMGAAYLAGISCGLYDPEHIFEHVRHSVYRPDMDGDTRKLLYSGWKKAVEQALTH